MSDVFLRLVDQLGEDRLVLFFLVLARIVPLIALSPVFGGPTIPRRHRVALTMLLSGALFAPMVEGSRLPTTEPLDVFVFAGREFLLGLVLAFTLRIVFEMVAATGEWIDLTRGATFANVLDPVNQRQTSLTSAFLMQLQLAVFFLVGGHRMVLSALSDGFQAWPPGQALLPEHFTATAIVDTFVDLFAGALELSVRLAFPVLATLFLVNIALALVNRAAPQIQIFFLAMPLRAALGIFVLALTLHALFEELWIVWNVDLRSLLTL